MRIVKILYVLQDFICALRLYVHFKTICAVQRHYARFKSFMRASKVLRALRRPYAHFESFTRIAKTLCALRKFYPQSEDIMRTAKTLCERKEDSIMKKIILDEKILADYRQSLLMAEKAFGTVDKYTRDIRTLMEYAGASPLTKELLIGYKEHLADLKLAPRSINGIISSINSLLDHLGRRDLQLKTLKVQQQVFCREERELTRPEYERLVLAARKRCNQRLSLILETLGSTGIRISELKYITVEAVEAGEAVVSCKRKLRTIFLVKALRRKLLRYAASRGIKTGMIFVTRTGRALDRSNIWREMKAICEEAAVKPGKVFPHNLRHLFARIFYNIEKDIAKLADILGHSSINTTRIYIISTGAEHRRKMEQMRMLI